MRISDAEYAFPPIVTSTHPAEFYHREVLINMSGFLFVYDEKLDQGWTKRIDKFNRNKSAVRESVQADSYSDQTTPQNSLYRP